MDALSSAYSREKTICSPRSLFTILASQPERCLMKINKSQDDEISAVKRLSAIHAAGYLAAKRHIIS